MDSIKPKRSLVEETYERLIDAICSGELPPGERLNQDDLAARLNVSRQPVNSAISILKTDGLVADTGRRSVVVTSFDPALFRSIYEYRRVIEPFAVRLAGASVTQAQRRQADRALEAGQKAIRKGNLRDLIRADMEFHELIYDLCGNQVVAMSMKTIWHHIRRSMGERLREPSAVNVVWEEHATIVDHLFSGRSEQAAEVMEQHIDRAYRSISESMKRSDPGNAGTAGGDPA